MKTKIYAFIREYSVPLLAGVLIAVIWANIDKAGYDSFFLAKIAGPLSLKFLVNDIFMTFFFAMAAIEIVVAASPGGALNSPGKALNPLIATFGGIIGPAGDQLGRPRTVPSSPRAGPCLRSTFPSP